MTTGFTGSGVQPGTKSTVIPVARLVGTLAGRSTITPPEGSMC